MKSKFFALAVIVVLTAMLTGSLVDKPERRYPSREQLEQLDRMAAESVIRQGEAEARAATQPTTQPALEP